MKKQIKTYDVVFNDNNNTNSKGMNGTINDCVRYIQQYNGTNESYFDDYKGGIVSVVCNETNETIFETTVK